MSTKTQVLILLGALGVLAAFAAGRRFGDAGAPRHPEPRGTELPVQAAPQAVADPGFTAASRLTAPEKMLPEAGVPGEAEDGTAAQEALQTPAKTRILELELREARQVILQLEGELEKKLKERLALEEQVRRLVHSLAEEKAHADRLRIRVKSPESGMGSEPPALAGVLEQTIRVVEVNRDNRVAILDAGRANGVRPGMVFGVLHDGVPVSRLRATDVRNRVSAAGIEDVREGQFPQAGDRAVPWTGGME